MVYNEISKHDELRVICQEASYIRMQRDSIYNNLHNARSLLRDLRNEWKTKSDALAEYKLELTKIPQ